MPPMIDGNTEDPPAPRLLARAPYYLTLDGHRFIIGLWCPGKDGFVTIDGDEPALVPRDRVLQATLMAMVFARDILQIAPDGYDPATAEPATPAERMAFTIRRLIEAPAEDRPPLISPIGPRLAFPDLDPEWTGSAAAFGQMFGPPSGGALEAAREASQAAIEGGANDDG